MWIEVDIPSINLIPSWYDALARAIVYVINDVTNTVNSMMSQMNYICISKLTIIGSDNGLSPVRCQAIIWTIIVNWTLRNKIKWNFNQNSYIFIQENVFENVICEMAAILSQHQCVNSHLSHHLYPAYFGVAVICIRRSYYQELGNNGRSDSSIVSYLWGISTQNCSGLSSCI